MSEVNLTELLGLVERELVVSLSHGNEGFCSKRLNEAKRYALSSPGKRLRPIMVLSSALACRGDQAIARTLKDAMPSACAVEYVHTYSLVHDDLPCMDDDDYRRGRLSVHRQFDEGLAVLVGDALLADAFLLASMAPRNAVAIVRELAQTAGSRGLVAGQAEDLAHTNETDQNAWLLINQAKTARLFEACAVLGGFSAGATRHELSALRKFGHHFGVAFQLKDDLDDKTGLALHDQAAVVLTMVRGQIEKAKEQLKELPHPQALRSLLHFTFATVC